jgi:hypothetical protein
VQSASRHHLTRHRSIQTKHAVEVHALPPVDLGQIGRDCGNHRSSSRKGILFGVPPGWSRIRLALARGRVWTQSCLGPTPGQAPAWPEQGPALARAPPALSLSCLELRSNQIRSFCGISLLHSVQLLEHFSPCGSGVQVFPIEVKQLAEAGI